jgi:hypothetical protein
MLQDNMATIQQARLTPSDTIPTPLPPLSPAPRLISAEKKKPTLPDPSKFTGVRNTFRAWLLEMKNKLMVDGRAIGGHREQFAYVYSRLERTPQNMTIAFVERGGKDGTHNPDQYLAYLDECYGDPNAQARAIDRLRTIRQKEDESFAAFLPKFEREMADSGGGEWVDAVQVNYLEGALNHKLRERLISISDIPRDYVGFVRIVQTISSRLDSLELSTKWSRRRRSPGQLTPTTTTDTMDWEPTKVNRTAHQGDDQLRGKRAKWVDQAEMDKRRRERRCFRCGRSECRVDKCPLQPPRRPDTNRTQVNKVYQAAVEEEEDKDTMTDQSSSDSGKE